MERVMEHGVKGRGGGEERRGETRGGDTHTRRETGRGRLIDRDRYCII